MIESRSHTLAALRLAIGPPQYSVNWCIFLFCRYLVPDILLFEDCSHAHGAKIDGRYVGTFGDAAAWSLQGQKLISGGEGGITLTKNTDLYYRQLLWGHL